MPVDIATIAPLISNVTPLILELIQEFRHRTDQPTANEIEQRFTAKYLMAKQTGADWLASHPTA